MHILLPMKPTTNPIFNRLITIYARPFRHFLAIVIMLFLTMITLFLFLDGRGLLDSFLRNVPIVALPAVVVCLFIFVGSAATLTLQESKGEAFQLLRMTNISAYHVVWAYVGGIVFRTRHYIVLFIFALPLTVIWTLLEVRRDVPFSVRISIFYEPNVVEVIVLFVVSAMMSLGSVFQFIAATIAQTLRTRQPLQAIATVMVTNGLFFVGFNGFLTLAIMSETRDTLPMVIGVILSIFPYALALLCARQWQTDPRNLAPILNTIPFALVIMAFFVLGGLSQQKTTLTFWAIFVVVAALLVRWIVLHQDNPRVPTRIGFLAWQATIACVLLLDRQSGYQNFREVMLWIVIVNLWLIQVAFGFQDLRRAMRYLWNERFYF